MCRHSTGRLLRCLLGGRVAFHFVCVARIAPNTDSVPTTSQKKKRPLFPSLPLSAASVIDCATEEVLLHALSRCVCRCYVIGRHHTELAVEREWRVKRRCSSSVGSWEAWRVECLDWLSCRATHTWPSVPYAWRAPWRKACWWCRAHRRWLSGRASLTSVSVGYRASAAPFLGYTRSGYWFR